MSHTTETKNCYFNYNGDYSGPIDITLKQESKHIEFEDLVVFVGEAAKSEHIKEIEDVDCFELLGLEEYKPIK